MGCHEEILVQQISQLFEKISKLETLKPSKDVDMLFTQLVLTCIPPSPIDVSKLPQKAQEMRCRLIKLCGQAEGLLESHFSKTLNSFPNPINHLYIFPYFNNYLKLSQLEYSILMEHSDHHVITKVAFVGSGPLPLTSIVLATKHLTATTFHNYDINPEANMLASGLVSPDTDLSQRMFFHTSDIMDVKNELRDYQVVFLAALVGMDKEQKIRIIDHLAKYMAPDAILMVRSAHGARGFLYPIVDSSDLRGFEVLSVFHPSDEVINSIVIARKNPMEVQSLDHHQGLGCSVMLPTKCCDQIQGFLNPLHQMNIIEEIAIEEQ